MKGSVKAVKWLKKRVYLFLFAGMGIVYLNCVDKWQVYAAPLARLKGWGQELYFALNDGGDNPQTEGQASNGEDGGQEPSGEAVSGDREEDTANPPEESASVEKIPEESMSNQSTSNEGEPGEGTESGQAPEEGEESPSGESPEEEPPGENGGEPVYMTVEDDYFADAVFIGDSRTVGLWEYGELEEITTFYASKGLTVYKLFDSAIVSAPEQREKITIEEALQQNTFAKIYLMIGINEMGTGTVDSFIEKYQEVVDHLQELQPDAILYLQAIIKVTAARSAKGDYIFNEGIVERNERIAQMADNKKIFFLDVNPLICDETGGMIPDYTFDGVHLKAKYIEIWKDYLKTHAISP